MSDYPDSFFGRDEDFPATEQRERCAHDECTSIDPINGSSKCVECDLMFYTCPWCSDAVENAVRHAMPLCRIT